MSEASDAAVNKALAGLEKALEAEPRPTILALIAALGYLVLGAAIYFLIQFQDNLVTQCVGAVG